MSSDIVSEVVEVTGMYTDDRLPTLALVLKQNSHPSEWGGYVSYTVLMRDELVEIHEVDISQPWVLVPSLEQDPAL